MLQLSQHSLTDFVDCPRRYYLQYVARQPWPLLETGPGGMNALEYREYLRRGVQLHRMIERHFVGQDSGFRIQDSEPGIFHSELSVWFARFLATDLGDLPPQRIPELALVAPLGDSSLYVRYDLLACNEPQAGDAQPNNRFVIIDWKTIRGERAPSIGWFRNRLQTRAYLYALVAAGSPFNNGAPIEPEQCLMRYWLANFPEHPWVEIAYSRADYEADKRRLIALATDIAARTSPADFELTDDERKCTYCNFRTLCRRAGAQGGESIQDDEPAVDKDDIPELEY